jgi:polysaccharide export outer membrane protein
MARDGAAFRVIEDFTGDHDRLANTIKHLSGDGSETPNAGKQLNGLRTASEVLGALPGKKAVVYFFDGMPATAATQEQLRAVTDSGVAANVAFFPIDVAGSAAVSPYVIAAGDTLSIWMWGDPGFDGAYTVRADGMISIPLVGEIRAAGSTALQLQHAIDQALLPRMRTPSSRVKVIAVHSQPAGN